MNKFYISIILITTLISCENKLEILNVELETIKNNEKDWSKFSLCFNEIPDSNISVLGITYNYKMIFTTKGNRKFESEGTFVAVKKNECVQINCSSLYKRGMTDDEFNFYHDEIVLDSIVEMSIQIFDTRKLYSNELLAFKKITEFKKMIDR